jgi:hypothetical protein
MPLVPVHPIAGCGCPLCYRGPWKHTVAPEDEPGFLRFVISDVHPRRWHDTCPVCVPPKGWREGAPLSWRLSRLALRIAAFLGTIAVYSHLFLSR